MGFFDGGNKTLSFGERGDQTWFDKWQGGFILNIGEPMDSMDFNDPSKKKTYKNGDVVTKIVVSLNTKIGKFPAPPLDAEDDGVRDWHIDRGYMQSKAVAKALRDAKVDDIATGGEIYVRWVSGKGEKGDARQFEAVYRPPVATSGGMFNEAPAEPAQPMPPQNYAQPAQPMPNPFGNQGQPAPQPAVQGPVFDPATGAPMNEAARAIIAQGMAVQQAAQAAPMQQVTNPFAQ